MSDFDPHEMNRQIMAEFRANDGKVASFGDIPIVILHTTGARSGQPRETPLAAQVDGEELYVFASAAGAPSHPAWYHNLVAEPSVTVEFGTDRFAATAEVLDGDERDEIYRRQAAAVPQFADYEQSAGDRTIPVVALRRT